MDSGFSGPTQASPTYCATCGRPLTAGLAACPNCGTPVSMVAPAAAPAYAATRRFPRRRPGKRRRRCRTPRSRPGRRRWPPRTLRRRRAGVGKLVIGGIASLLVVALLATGVAYVFGAFAGHAELDAAKYLPAKTFAFSGVDVYSLAENSHNISLNTLVNGGSGSLTSGSGLDWANDVLPWLGRDIAAGAFPGAASTNDASGSSVAGVALHPVARRHQGAGRDEEGSGPRFIPRRRHVDLQRLHAVQPTGIQQWL